MDFKPPFGTIKPKSSIPIRFAFQPLYGGYCDEIFVCNIEGMKPLGFEIKTKVLGLSCEFELVKLSEEGEEEKKISLMETIKIPGGSKFKSKFVNSMNASKSSIGAIATEDKDVTKLDKLNFYNCYINKPKIVIKKIFFNNFKSKKFV